jgi:hypothetical protein
MVLAHARALGTGDSTAVIKADLRDVHAHWRREEPLQSDEDMPQLVRAMLGGAGCKPA